MDNISGDVSHSEGTREHLMTSPEIFKLQKMLHAHCLGSQHLEILAHFPLGSETDFQSAPTITFFVVVVVSIAMPLNKYMIACTIQA